MSSLSTRLKNINEAGVCQLNCTVDELRASAAQVQFPLFEMDMAQLQSKGEFLAELARAIHAPDWFGGNWDAMADALNDLSWQPAAGYILVLHHSGEQQLLSIRDYSIMQEILLDTVVFWKAEGKPFWVFFC
ncbi:MAG: barstar family protein [Candidatus Nitrotoga sp.]